MFKAYQQCFVSSFNSIYERVEGDVTLIVHNESSIFYSPFDDFGNLVNDTSLFISSTNDTINYYIFEPEMTLTIDDPLFDTITSNEDYTV